MTAAGWVVKSYQGFVWVFSYLIINLNSLKNFGVVINLKLLTLTTSLKWCILRLPNSGGQGGSTLWIFPSYREVNLRGNGAGSQRCVVAHIYDALYRMRNGRCAAHTTLPTCILLETVILKLMIA